MSVDKPAVSNYGFQRDFIWHFTWFLPRKPRKTKKNAGTGMQKLDRGIWACPKFISFLTTRLKCPKMPKLAKNHIFRHFSRISAFFQNFHESDRSMSWHMSNTIVDETCQDTFSCCVMMKMYPSSMFHSVKVLGPRMVRGSRSYGMRHGMQ